MCTRIIAPTKAKCRSMSLQIVGLHAALRREGPRHALQIVGLHAALRREGPRHALQIVDLYVVKAIMASLGRQYDHDVIVVGAGPAGSAAAAQLARGGADVLLIDRATFPRDKTCGDAVPAEAIRLLHQLGMAEAISAAVDRSELYALATLLLVSPRGVEVTATFDDGTGPLRNYVSRRVHFDAVLQQHAVQSGATFLNAKVTGALRNVDQVRGVVAATSTGIREIRAPMVIAADGVTSSIARGLRADAHEDSHRAVALRAYVSGIEELPKTIEFYLYKEILPGYAWVFPLGGDTANVGLGMRLDKLRKSGANLRSMLDRFFAMPAIRKRLRDDHRVEGVRTWQLDFGSKTIRRAFPGALLVGDAAGLIDPLTGGGIYNAILSATLAADATIDALHRGDFSMKTLASYDQRCNESLRADFRRSHAIQRTLLRFPLLIDVLASVLRSNNQLAKAFALKL